MSEPVAILTIAITARALFHMEDSHALFEREGIAAFASFQRANEDVVLAPGCKDSEAFIRSAFEAEIHRLDPTYHVSISFDRAYTQL